MACNVTVTSTASVVMKTFYVEWYPSSARYAWTFSYPATASTFKQLFDTENHGNYNYSTGTISYYSTNYYGYIWNNNSTNFQSTVGIGRVKSKPKGSNTVQGTSKITLSGKDIKWTDAISAGTTYRKS